jgi:excisionase family DNA binding protein
MSIHSCGASRHAGAGKPPGKPLTVTVKQACEISNLGNTKIYELIRDGRLKAVKVDGRTLIIYASIEALLGCAA